MMNNKKYTVLQKSLLISSLVSLSFGVVNLLPVQANDMPNQVASAFNITFDPPNESQPKATKGGASRGSQCVFDSQADSEPFAPLLPTTNIGLTTASHPTLLVHIPATSAESVFLTLQDENEDQVYQAILPIGNKSGIVSLDIPKDAPALETGKNYKWSFALMCDNKLRPDSPIVQGYVKRVELQSQLANQLQQATPVEMAALYGKAGIWYETIATLAQLRQNQPQNNDLKTAWNDILNSVGLEKVAKAELVE